MRRARGSLRASFPSFPSIRWNLSKHALERGRNPNVWIVCPHRSTFYNKVHATVLDVVVCTGPTPSCTICSINNDLSAQIKHSVEAVKHLISSVYFGHLQDKKPDAVFTEVLKFELDQENWVSRSGKWEKLNPDTCYGNIHWSFFDRKIKDTEKPG